MKDVIDTSYNRLLDVSDLSTDKTHNNYHNKEKILNKTTEMHNVVKQANLKNSAKIQNSQNHSYLSTPMLLIQKEKKPITQSQIFKKKSEKKEPKKSLKYVLKPSDTKKAQPEKSPNNNHTDSS